MDDLTQKIRERAHELWEAAGKPHDMEHEHWSQAERQILGSDDQSETSDQQLDDTFPSSDPISETQPGGELPALAPEKISP